MARGATREQLDRAEYDDYVRLDEAFIRQGEATLVQGGRTFERMGELARHIGELLRGGVNPADVLAVCPTPAAAQAFAELVRREACEDAPDIADAAGRIEVVTARQLTLRVLADPQAADCVERRFPASGPRIPSAFEVDFILEDLKTLGMRPGRLREVLKFIYRGWTELSDEVEGWLVTVEEHDVVSNLLAEAGYLQVIMEPEAANLACKAVRRSDDVRARFARKHVLVGEYQMLSRASQLLCCALALDSLVASGSPDQVAEVYDSYPYAAGLGEFLAVNPHAQTRNMPGSPSHRRVTQAVWEDPAAEVSALADEVARRVEDGQPPEEIAVACFHPHWHNQVVRALASRGLAVNGLYQPLVLKGDVRDLDGALPLRIATVLRLLSDPGDSAAWRCWVGFGDYLGRSLAFVPQRERDLAANPHACFADAARASDAGAHLEPLLESCQGKTGARLLEHLAQCLSGGQPTPVPASLARLAALGSDATAAEMTAELDRLEHFGAFPFSEGVTVGSPESLVGRGFSAVYAVGLVDGLLPSSRCLDRAQVSVNRQKRLLDEARRRAEVLPNLSSGVLVLGSFQSATCEFAERYGLRQNRIYVDDSLVRRAKTSPSMFTEGLLAASGS